VFEGCVQEIIPITPSWTLSYYFRVRVLLEEGGLARELRSLGIQDSWARTKSTWGV